MAKVTYRLPEQEAHDLTADLEARQYGAVMPPPHPGEDGRRVVVTVDDDQEAELQQLVDRLAPDAERL